MENLLYAIVIGMVAAICGMWVLPVAQRKYDGLCESHLELDFSPYRTRYVIVLGSLIVGLSALFLAEVPMRGAIHGLLAVVGTAIGMFDLKYQIIPDRMHLMGAACVVCCIIFVGSSTVVTSLLYWNLIQLIALTLTTWVYGWIRKKPSLGMGDLKLLVWMLPLLQMPLVVLLLWASVLGGLFWAMQKLMMRKGSRGGTLAFAPCLFLPFLASLMF